MADLQGDDDWGLDDEAGIKMEEEEVPATRELSALLNSSALKKILAVCASLLHLTLSQEIPKYENKVNSATTNWFTAETKDPEYDLIVEANEMAGKIGFEINLIHAVRISICNASFIKSHHDSKQAQAKTATTAMQLTHNSTVTF